MWSCQLENKKWDTMVKNDKDVLIDFLESEDTNVESALMCRRTSQFLTNT